MSDKDQIREMVYALARGDHEAAREASKAVFAAKTKRIAEAALENETEETVEGEEELEEGMHNPAHRRSTAARRHMRRARDVEVAREARRDDADDEDEYVVRRRKRRPSASMKRRRPRPSDMYEGSSDTGADSATVKGSNDHTQDDNTERKGSVKDSGVVKGSHDDTKEDNTQRKGSVKDSGSVKGSHDAKDSGAK